MSNLRYPSGAPPVLNHTITPCTVSSGRSAGQFSTQPHLYIDHDQTAYRVALKALAAGTGADWCGLYIFSGGHDNDFKFSRLTCWHKAAHPHELTGMNSLFLAKDAALRNGIEQHSTVACDTQALYKVSPVPLGVLKKGPVLVAPIVTGSSVAGLLVLKRDFNQQFWTGDERNQVELATAALTPAIQSELKQQNAAPDIAQFRRMMNASPDLLWSMDIQGRWTYMSPMAERIFGYVLSEMLNRPCSDFLDPEKKQDLHAIFDAFKRGEKFFRTELNFVREDDSKVTLLCSAIPLFDEYNRLVGACGSGIEITDLKNTIKLLEERQQCYQMAAGATHEVVWDWNMRSHKIWMNLDSRELFGYNSKDLESVARWKFKGIHSEDRKKTLDSLREALKEKKHRWSAEYRFRYGKDFYAQVLDRAHIIYDRQLRPVRMIGAMNDVSAQKRYEQQLRDSRERLRKLAVRVQNAREQERTMLARELHDEFAQVLTALKLDLTWLRRKLSEEDVVLQGRIEEMSCTIEQTMERVWKVASDLRPKLLDDLGLKAAIQCQLAKYQERTGALCGARLLALDGLKPGQELEIAIYRIFQEALSNIARHTNADRVEVTATRNQHHLELTINDNGAGIPPDRVDDINSLGLEGMRERAGVFGGRVKIEPLAAGGTRVLLRVPWRNFEPDDSVAEEVAAG